MQSAPVPMPVFYINVAARTDRRDYMEAQFSDLGVTAQRIDAVTPATIAPEFLARFCHSARRQWVSPPELACTLSHRRIWQVIVDGGIPSACVFEDDAKLSSRVPDALRLMPDQIRDLDVVRLQTNTKDVSLGRAERELLPSVSLHRVFTAFLGTTGYVITANGARKLLAAEPFFSFPVDELMFDPNCHVARSLSVRQVVPGLCIAAGFGSDIAEDLLQRQKVHDAPILKSPVRRFFWRLRRDIGDSARRDIAKIFHGARHVSVPFADS